MRRQQKKYNKVRSTKKDKYRNNKNQIPKRFPFANRKAMQKFMKECRNKNKIIDI